MLRVMARKPEVRLTRGHRKKQKTRRQLLEAGLRVLRSKGESLTARDVTQEADVSSGTFYNYFTDTDALIDAVMRQELLGISATAVRESVSDPALRIAVAATRILQRAIADPQWARLVLRLVYRPSERLQLNRYLRDDLIEGPSHPYLYLDLAAIADAGLDEDEVARFVAREAEKLPHIHRAFAAADLHGAQVTDEALADTVRRSYEPTRSGQVHLVQPPYWFVHSTQEAGKLGLAALASIHGSPWAYDQHVPIIFAGGALPDKHVARPVHPIDVAPTLSALMGYLPPAGAQGNALPEVLKQ